MVASALDAVVDRLRAGPIIDQVERHRPLGPLTTYKVGGPAAVFVTVETRVHLEATLAAVAGSQVDFLVVGRGSNLLVADAGFDGVALLLAGEFEAIDIDGTLVTAGGAAPLPVVARATVAAGLTGFEWAVGVPGSIGGAVRMNAGGHGSDMSASLTGATVADLESGRIDRWSRSDLDLGYRQSAVEPRHLVVDATLSLEPGDPRAGEAELSEIVRWRREHQPGGQNAGSVFTNPVGDSAGRLIDAAGGKGLRLGTAEVSAKHANFIQADPGGSADDVWALMRMVRQRVVATHGIELEVETRLIGFGAEPW